MPGWQVTECPSRCQKPHQQRLSGRQPGRTSAGSARAVEPDDRPNRCLTLGCTICATCTRPLLLAGVPVHVVAARLGHADPAVTLHVYSHVLREHAVSVADIFAWAVQGSR
jgi:integrase